VGRAMFALSLLGALGVGAAAAARRLVPCAALGPVRDLSSRKKTTLRLATGYYGRSKNCWRIARRRVEKALQYAYISRRLKKRDARKLWITQVNAGAREHGLIYSHLVHGMALAKVGLNRKVLAQLAIQEPYSFKAVVEEARAALQRQGSPEVRAAAEAVRATYDAGGPVTPAAGRGQATAGQAGAG